MNTTEDELDYYRAMLRRSAPAPGAEELAWLRFVAQLLVELGRLAPHFTIAMAAEHRRVGVVGKFFETGKHESALAAGVPMCLGFVFHYLGEPVPAALKDLARAEVWVRHLQGELSVPEELLRRELDVRFEHGVDYVHVRSDVVAELERLRGYASMAYAQAAQALWFLRQEPVYPLLMQTERPGVLAFRKHSHEVALSFVPLSALTRAEAS